LPARPCRRPWNSERHEVVRESRDCEARGPNLFGGRGSHQAVGRRRARAGRGLLVRRRVHHGQQVSLLGVPGVQGVAGERGVQVRAGARRQPRHHLPRHAVIVLGAAPARKADASVPAMLSLLSGDQAAFGVMKAIEATTGCVPLVHVDDLCRAEIFLAEETAAAGRYNCGSLNTTIVEIARFLAHKYPQYNVNTDNLPGDLLEKPRVCLSSEKLVGQGFEFKYKTLDEIYDNVVEYGKALGLLPN